MLILQLPFFLHHLRHPEPGAGPTGAIGAAARAASGEAPLDVAGSARALAHSIEIMLVEPAHPGWTWVVLLVAGAIVVAGAAGALASPEGPALRGGRQGPALGGGREGPAPGLDVALVTVLPLALAVLGYSVLQRHNDYWYLPLAPSAALMVAFAVATALPARRARLLAGALALAAIVVAQPARFHHSRLLNRLPEYGTLVAASRQMVRDGVSPRDIHAAFVRQPTDPTFLFTVLGGRLDPNSPIEADILPTGRVVYRGTAP